MSRTSIYSENQKKGFKRLYISRKGTVRNLQRLRKTLKNEWGRIGKVHDYEAIDKAITEALERRET